MYFRITQKSETVKTFRASRHAICHHMIAYSYLQNIQRRESKLNLKVIFEFKKLNLFNYAKPIVQNLIIFEDLEKQFLFNL